MSENFIQKPRINIYKNGKDGLAYQFSAFSLGLVAIWITQDNLINIQNATAIEVKRGQLIGQIHFNPFGLKGLNQDYIKDKYGRPSQTTWIPAVPIVIRVILGLRAFIEEIDTNKLDEPELIYSFTNLQMAGFSNRIGFDIPGYISSEDSRSKRSQILKQMQVEDIKSVYVTTTMERLRYYCSSLVEGGALDYLRERVVRVYGEDTTKLPRKLTYHPLHDQTK